jgi:putative Ca2+/H+ antiporter (TMEM165/GDT1 family)
VNFAVVGTVFALIFVGELPDKTMVAALVMSTRGRPFTQLLTANLGPLPPSWARSRPPEPGARPLYA